MTEPATRETAHPGEPEPLPSGVPLGRVLGVPVVVRPSWFGFAALIVVLLGPQLTPREGTLTAYAAASGFAVLLGLSVLLHEIGHCVVARFLGLPVRSITITLLAGLTEVTRPPRDATGDYAVAIAGPLVSILLCGLGFGLAPVADPDSLSRLALQGLGVTNGVVAVFNLLPGLPLDGGRVLRAAVWGLSRGSDPEGLRASRIAARAGQVVAVVVVPAFLLVGVPAVTGVRPTLLDAVLAAVFASVVWAGATAALRHARMQEVLPHVTAGGLARPALAVRADLPVAELVRRVQSSGAGAAVLVDATGAVTGVVSEAAVKAVPHERRPWVSAGSVARTVRAGDLVRPDEDGTALVERLRSGRTTEWVVVDPDDEPGAAVAVLVVEDLVAALTRLPGS